MKDEISLYTVIEQALYLKKNCFLPIIKDNELYISKLNNLDEVLKKNILGFYEIENNFPNDYNKISEILDLIFVPALCFDKKGNRLGRGKGFYDKFFVNISRQNIITTGIIPDILLFSDLDFIDPWDQKVDYIITEKKLMGSLYQKVIIS